MQEEVRQFHIVGFGDLDIPVAARHHAGPGVDDEELVDIEAEGIRTHVPQWYRKSIPAASFALFPIIIGKAPIGMLYGDADAGGRLKFPADELAMLKTLRNQAVLAIKHHSP